MDYHDFNAARLFVIDMLKQDYELNAKSDQIDCDGELIEPDEELLSAFSIVLGYYMTHTERQDWLNSLQKDSTV